MVKRLLLSIRNWKGLTSQILLPVIFIAFGMLMGIIASPSMMQEPPLTLGTSQYLNITKMADDSFIPFAAKSTDELTMKLVDTLLLPSGVGAECSLEDPLSNTTRYAQSCYDAFGNVDDLINRHQEVFLRGWCSSSLIV